MKKVFAILLAGLMLVSIVACNSDPAEQTGTEADSGEQTTATVDGTGESENTEPGQTENETETETETETEPEEENELKTIDIYLIAGQSNAVGHSYVKNASALYERAEGLKNGYTHVLYAGNARSDTNSNTTLVNNEKSWQRVTLNLGRANGYMGPEAGMAEALSRYYNEESGKTAGIIKLAHGGTCLRNATSGSSQHGNWVSPSYAEHLGVSFSGVTGGLYRALLDQVAKNVAQLDGFDKINIKGIYWMQGESDRSNPTEYAIAFDYFVKDLRRDLSARMKEVTGTEDDLGASEIAVFVGSISETYHLYDGTVQNNVNKPFIAMQKNLCETIERCIFVDNTGYEISYWDGTTEIVKGSDKHHWNQDDMLSIGINVGELMLKECVYSEQYDEMWEDIYNNYGDGHYDEENSEWTSFQ